MTVAITSHKKRRSDLMGTPCNCCKGWEQFPRPCELDGCDHLIHASDEAWVRLDVMHHNRVGLGPISLCSKEHALAFLALLLPENEDEAGPLRLPGCEIAGHLPELEAICAALEKAAKEIRAGHVNQINAAALDTGRLLADMQQRDAFVRARAVQRARSYASYWDGVLRGVRDVLNAISRNNDNELHILVEQYLDHIDWQSDPPRFTLEGDVLQETANGSAEAQADG